MRYKKKTTILGSANNAIAMQQTAKQIKANTIHRYERWGSKPKLKLESINVSHNTATYVRRESDHSAHSPIVYQRFVGARKLNTEPACEIWGFRKNRSLHISVFYMTVSSPP